MDNLELPKTKLAFRGGVLTRHSAGDKPAATFAAKDILGVRIEDTNEFGPAILIGTTFFALSVVSKLYIESPGWSWAATILCLAITAFSAMMVRGKVVAIETSNGVVSYPIVDPFEEAEGFVLSLRHLLEEDPDAEARTDD